MAPSAELLSALDVALNEADLHHARVREDTAQALIDLVVLTLPEAGPEPDLQGRTVSLSLLRVGRVIASLREGRWDDESAPVTPFQLDQLDQVTGGFGVQPIYGWEFFDAPGTTWQQLGDRISLDLTILGGVLDHTLDLFQESGAGPSSTWTFDSGSGTYEPSLTTAASWLLRTSQQGADGGGTASTEETRAPKDTG